jgi:hypothetical protein
MDNNEKKQKVSDLCRDIEKFVHQEIDNPTTPYKDYYPFELIYMIVATTYENALLKQLAAKLPGLTQTAQQGLHLVPNTDNVPTSDPGPVFPFENVPTTQVSPSIPDDFENLQEFEGKGKILHFRPKNKLSN